MRRNWRQNGVLLTMLVLVGTAVFLNWKYTDAPSEETGTKILGESTLVSGDGDGGETNEATVYTGGDYFASARLTRQQARDTARELLEEAAAQEGAKESAATDAAEGIQVLAAYTLAEAQVENLVTAKGYADCVAFMSDDGISVVVSLPEGTLSAADVAKIMDIAKAETGYPAEKIRIMAAN